MNKKQERQAWTDFVLAGAGDAPSIEGAAMLKAKPKSKYGNIRESGYDSRHEASEAAKLWALQRAGIIFDLQEQVRIVLVEGNGKERAITYIADFTYRDKEGKLHVLDAKGFKTQVYRLKKRLASLLLNIQIEEI